MSKRFRIERSDPNLSAEPGGSDVKAILSELLALKANTQRPPAAVDSAIELWSGVEDIQSQIATTKTEIGALYARGAGDPSKNRTADELRAVVEGTEGAAETILAAAEMIDGVVQPHLSDPNSPGHAEAETIAACVVQIYEACNFQDITGQRITKVINSLEFIEARIASMISVWKNSTLTVAAEPDKSRLLNGPALEGDRSTVSQDEVDALFS